MSENEESVSFNNRTSPFNVVSSHETHFCFVKSPSWGSASTTPTPGFPMR